MSGTLTPPTAASAAETSASPRPAFDVRRLRKDFPILQEQIRGRPLVYLDNAATSQKPRSVIGAVDEYYQRLNSNIHRGVHWLSEKATAAYERARKKTADLLNAQDLHEVIFTRGTTESINLVAQSWGRSNLREGDEVLITAMEHHSNIVPWQIVCEQTGAKLKVAPINDAGEVILEEYERLLSGRTKLVGMVHLSNALGTINPVQQMTRLARRHGALVLVDGAQSAPHMPVDVREIGCDFYAFSAHKLYGPTGIGVLWGRRDLLEAMPPYQGGGEMISSVSFEKSTYKPAPHKFEAGTPHIAGGVGLGAAIDYVNSIGLEAVAAYEAELLVYGTEALKAIPGVRLIGTARHKASVLSFIIDGVHPHDVGTILDQEGIAIRTGHHCAQPVMDRFNVPATARASLAFYNTKEEIDALANGILKVKEIFA